MVPEHSPLVEWFPPARTDQPQPDENKLIFIHPHTVVCRLDSFVLLVSNLPISTLDVPIFFLFFPWAKRIFSYIGTV